MHFKSGQEFGQWKLIKWVSGKWKKHERWLAECGACGNEKLLLVCNAERGGSNNCGCVRKQSLSRIRKTHGLSGGSLAGKRAGEYHVWAAMKDRCSNPNNRAWKNYGGRGIRICDRWTAFKNFHEDMGFRPTPKHTLERKDNSGPYSPGNCVWATRKEQCSNKRGNVFLEHEGLRLTVSQWADKIGVHRNQLAHRLERGYSVAEALAVQPRQRKRQLHPESTI